MWVPFFISSIALATRLLSWPNVRHTPPASLVFFKWYYSNSAGLSSGQ